MTDLDTTKWLTALEAARRLSERAGFVVTTDDIRQLRRYKKLTQSLPINTRTVLYNADEIDTVKPPKKRIHHYKDFDEYADAQREWQRTRWHKGTHRQDESHGASDTPLSP